jgi:DNA-binding FadR family transcriptional regulator
MNINSLVNKTLDRLMEVIFSTEPGCTIPAQEELSIRFGVSRTVLREALSKLEYLNVITARPKTGSKVNPPAEWRVINSDVLQWRVQAGEPVSVLPAAPELLEALHEGRRAIGEHFAPDHCYATGPVTGDAFRDLVQCPACSFIAMYDAVITKATGAA